MAILGVLARVHIPDRAKTLQQLSHVDGATPFSVEEEGRIGILIEKDTMEEAAATLAHDVEHVVGVLGTWPVFSHFESELPADAQSPDVEESSEADVHEE